MAAKPILSNNQQKILELISKEKKICDNFYLSGGTALAEFYLQHRLSEDLDFFNENEFDSQAVFIFLKSIQKKAGIKKIDVEQSFNRNIFFLYLNNEILKTEFTYFPFPRIEKKVKKNNLYIDSILDIAVNKIFTIYQKPRSRDFIDLHLIIKEKKYKMDDLLKKARVKFDWHIDPIQLGARFLEVKTVKDYPRMIKKIEPAEWQDFFVDLARNMKKDVFDL